MAGVLKLLDEVKKSSSNPAMSSSQSKNALSFAPYMKSIVLLLWSNGVPREGTPTEFGTAIGVGAYANHNKLSLPPWDLVENGSTPKSRRLTPKGIRFAQGQEQIPRKLVKDPLTQEWTAATDTEMIFVSDV